MAVKNKIRAKSMPVGTLSFIAWSNIRDKKLRSSLTIVGVMIGVAAIFFLLSFGIGLQKLVSDQVIGDESIKSIEISTPNSRTIKLNDEAINKFKSNPNITKVGTLFLFPSSISYRGGETGSIVYGPDNNYLELDKPSIVKGRMINDTDKNSVVISKGALRAVGANNPDSAIGQKINVTIPLNNVEAKTKPIKGEYTIVGVVDTGNGNEIFLPGAVFNQAGIGNYSQVKIIANDTQNVDKLRKQIGNSGFETASPIDTLGQINQIFRFFNVILVGFGAIGMIVAILGMFNTLTVSLIERTKEIGLMIALGAQNKDMSRLFKLEAIILSVVGATLGISIAIIGGIIVNQFMNRLAFQRGVNESFNLFSTPVWLIVLSILTMTLIGFLVVLIPAGRAKRINPISALRHE